MLVANFLVVCSSPSCTFHVADRSCRLCGCCTNVRLRRTIFSFVSMLKQNYDCHAAVMLTCTNPALLRQTFKTDLNRLRNDHVKIIFVVNQLHHRFAIAPQSQAFDIHFSSIPTKVWSGMHGVNFCTHGKEVRHFVYYLFFMLQTCIRVVRMWVHTRVTCLQILYEYHADRNLDKRCCKFHAK